MKEIIEFLKTNSSQILVKNWGVGIVVADKLENSGLVVQRVSMDQAQALRKSLSGDSYQIPSSPIHGEQ